MPEQKMQIYRFLNYLLNVFKYLCGFRSGGRGNNTADGEIAVFRQEFQVRFHEDENDFV